MKRLTTFALLLLVTNFVVSDPVRVDEDLTRPNRVVGGEPVNPGDIPWQVSLQKVTSKYSSLKFHFCGGTLIAPSWVVTAGHCIDGADLHNIIAVVGAWDLTEDNTEYRIEKGYTKEYNSATMENDIALLKLDIKNPLKLSTRTGRSGTPILLEKKKNIVIRRENACLISGWGRLASKGKLPEVLHAAKISLQSDEECSEALDKAVSMKITKSNVCAGGGAVDTCQGDSGGSLVCCSDASSPDASSCRLIGVTSWGIGCATPGLPGVYTEVAYYDEWIANIMDGEEQNEIAEA